MHALCRACVRPGPRGSSSNISYHQCPDSKLHMWQVKQHRRQYRARRAEAPIPVVAIVGYTNAGKSSLLCRVTSNPGAFIQVFPHPAPPRPISLTNPLNICNTYAVDQTVSQLCTPY